MEGRSEKQTFLANSFSLACLLLSIIVFVTGLFLENMIQEFMITYRWIHWAFLAAGFILVVVIYCLKKTVRKMPTFFIVAFTALAAFIVAGFSSYGVAVHAFVTMVQALFMFGSLLLLTVFFDDKHYGYLKGFLAAFVGVLFPTIICALIYPQQWLYVVLSGLFEMILSIYTIWMS